MILYLVMQNSPTGSDTLKTYNLGDCKEGRPVEINPTKFCATTCKLFYFKNISLLIGKYNNETWTLNLYQFDKKASWIVVPHSKFSISVLQFNLENSIPISLKDDGVILASVIYDQSKKACRITFHIFSQAVSGKNWKSINSQPLSQIRKCEIQSCIVISNDIYCSLLTDTGAHVYKFDLNLLQQNRKESKDSNKDDGIRANCNWQIKMPTLQNCFLSVFKEEPVIITFHHVGDKSIMELKRPMINGYVSPPKCQFEFPHVEIALASFVLSFENPVVAVIYRDKKNKYIIKRLTILSI